VYKAYCTYSPKGVVRMLAAWRSMGEKGQGLMVAGAFFLVLGLLWVMGYTTTVILTCIFTVFGMPFLLLGRKVWLWLLK